MKIPVSWIVIVILIIVLSVSFAIIKTQTTEIKRTTSNQNNLLEKLEVFELEKKEFQKRFKRQAHVIDSLGIKLNRVIFTTQTVTETKTIINTVFKDSITNKLDTLKCMQFATPHLIISGCLDAQNRFTGFYQSTDTITQIIHRIPKIKILGLRIGTKGIEQTVVSSNPNSIISYKNYIYFKK